MASEPSGAATWPDPYLQPDPSRDCSFYAVAYAARCFHYDVSADDVRAWRATTNRHEDHYLASVHGIPTQRWTADRDDDTARRRWWMGPDQREWVAALLAQSLCVVHLRRIPTMSHVVVALEPRPDGVLIMDPIIGHTVEPWSAFLGLGAGTRASHFVATAHARKSDRGATS